MIYIYPIDFESKLTYRKSIIVNSIFAIILFQIMTLPILAAIQELQDMESR